MSRKLPLGMLFLLIGVMLTACARSQTALPASAPGSSAETVSRMAGAPEGAKNVADVPDVAPRLVVRTANLDAVVDDPAQAADAIAALAQELGGFVVQSRLYKRSGSDGISRMYGTVTVRVPADAFDQALKRIAAMAVRIDRSEVQGKDVTEEYVDLQARLKNLEATRDQLQRIMAQATTTEEVLQVYQRLSEVQGEIEQVEGRIKYLKTSAAMSVITVNLTPSEAAKPFSIGGWQPVGVAKDALLMTLRTLRGLANVLIWLVLYFVPVIAALVLVFGVPGWWLWRWAYRRWVKPKAKATQTKEQA